MEWLVNRRAKLEKMDRDIVALVAQRFREVRSLWEWKRQHGYPLEEPDQEVRVEERARRWAAQEHVDADAVNWIIAQIVRESKDFARSARPMFIDPTSQPVIGSLSPRLGGEGGQESRFVAPARSRKVNSTPQRRDVIRTAKA